MKYTFAATLAVATVLTSGIALAADMPVKARPVVVPINTWDGYYIGLNGGYSWGRWDSTATGGQAIFPNGSQTGSLPGSVTAGAGIAGLQTFLNGAVTNTASSNVDGWVFGVHYGRNWQFDRWILGLESDWDWTGERARLDGTSTFTFRTETTTFTSVLTHLNDWSLRWFSTTRGRVGWLADAEKTWLLYATGGLAVGRVQFGHTTAATVSATTIIGGATTTSSTVTTASESKTKWGWVAGAGVEKMFAKDWLARVEYLYMDLGDHTFLVGTGFDTNVRLRDHIVRGGITYRIGCIAPFC